MKTKKIKKCPCCGSKLKEVVEGGWANQFYLYKCKDSFCGFRTPLKESVAHAEDTAVAVLSLYRQYLYRKEGGKDLEISRNI